ncbi:hypothetical protein T09_9413, partial [Trichinella sp. T9]
MKEHDDDVSGVYQQHSCHRRSSVAEANCSLKSFCEYEDKEDSVGCTVISFIFCNMSVLQCFNDVIECMVMMFHLFLIEKDLKCILVGNFKSNSNNSKWREGKRVHWYEEDMHERTI